MSYSDSIPVHPEDARPRASALVRRLSLKPFGENLLTPGADFWIFSARILIVVMATAEAIAWGYVGWLVSATAPWLSAAIAALFVFLLIWIIDASFMTLDLGDDSSRGKERIRVIGGIAARLLIVTVSLIVTAPFLAQAIFSGDIEAEIESRNATERAATRAAVDATLTAEIESLREEQRALERQRIDEAAGVGPSGRYGRGPAVATIERQLSEKRREIERAISEREVRLDRFDSLTSDELERSHGVTPLEKSVGTSTAMLSLLRERPDFARAENAIKAFLLLLFVGLLILKLFQPRSVAVYYDENLQGLFARWSRGAFDAYLDAGERARDGDRIEPLRFAEWYQRTWRQVEEDESKRRERAAERALRDERLDQWASLEAGTEQELSSLSERKREIARRVAALEEEIAADRREEQRISDQLPELESRLGGLRAKVDEGSVGADGLALTLDAIATLHDRRSELLIRRSEIVDRIEQTEARKSALASEMSRIELELRRREDLLDELSASIVGERRAYASSLSPDFPA